MLHELYPYNTAIAMDGDSFFHQWEMAEKPSRLFSIRVKEGKGHQFYGPTTLPMGYKNSVYIAQNFWEVVLAKVGRVEGATAMVWVDNLLILGVEESAAEELYGRVVERLEEVGCAFHEEARGSGVEVGGADVGSRE